MTAGLASASRLLPEKRQNLPIIWERSMATAAGKGVPLEPTRRLVNGTLTQVVVYEVEEGGVKVAVVADVVGVKVSDAVSEAVSEVGRGVVV